MTRVLRLASLDALKKRTKYGNKKKMIDGIEFDSVRESRRYQDLALMQHAKHIVGLRRQVPFEISVNGVFICKWIADFVYDEYGPDKKSQSRVVEDCKGFRTPEYKLKKKLVEAMYKFRIKET